MQYRLTQKELEEAVQFWLNGEVLLQPCVVTAMIQRDNAFIFTSERLDLDEIAPIGEIE